MGDGGRVVSPGGMHVGYAIVLDVSSAGESERYYCECIESLLGWSKDLGQEEVENTDGSFEIAEDEVEEGE